MKRILLMLMLLLPIYCLAQVSPYKYWNFENRAVLFDAVYEQPGVTELDLKQKLLTHLSSVKGIGEIRENSSGITAEMNNYRPDIKRMGYNGFSAPIFLNNPFSGNISILIKEGKYKVIITNIVSNKSEQGYEKRQVGYNLDIENMLLKLNKSGWSTSRVYVTIGLNLENDFYDSFQIKEIKSDW